MILNGAEVIFISKKDNFGVVKYTDDSIKPISIKYLAICQYENSKEVYVFLCNDKLEVEQDNLFDTIEEAKQYTFNIYKNVIWEKGIQYISFDNIDFKDGQVKEISSFDEDMLEVYYPNGYMIDVGYIEHIQCFVISIIKGNDWVNIVKQIDVNSDIELQRALQESIKLVSEL